MPPFNSLGKRIVKAYLLFSLACSLFFVVVAAVVIEGIEVKLVDERLLEVAAWASPRHAGRLPVAMPAGMSFHHGASIPGSLRALPPGIHELSADGRALRVLAGTDAAGPYVVVDHESEFERVEYAVYALLGLGFAGFIAMSLILGRFVARRVVAPIVALSSAVAEGREELPMQERDDELGILARALAAHTAELRLFLERERCFTGDVSHELRTPLTIISGAAELLLLEAGASATLRAPVERIQRAARDAAESVGILLLLARSPELIDADEISMASLVRDEVARHQGLVAGKQVALDYAGGADFTVRAPARLVAAALGNLIRNACLYTDAGSVTVALEGHAVVVRDSGGGLPQAVLAMLAGGSSGGRKGEGEGGRGSEGTGLGLALVMRICRYLGATLDVDSGAGGTVFRIGFQPV